MTNKDLKTGQYMALPSHMHRIGYVGQYAAFWDQTRDRIEIRADPDKTVHQVKAYPRVSVAKWDDEPDLAELVQFIEAEDGEAGPLTREEIMFLLDMARSVQTWTEHAPHDLERYGEIGVTC